MPVLILPELTRIEEVDIVGGELELSLDHGHERDELAVLREDQSLLCLVHHLGPGLVGSGLHLLLGNGLEVLLSERVLLLFPFARLDGHAMS